MACACVIAGRGISPRRPARTRRARYDSETRQRLAREQKSARANRERERGDEDDMRHPARRTIDMPATRALARASLLAALLFFGVGDA
jgi:hypothetical protein